MSYKILSMSDSILLSTGYATITREIMKRLAKEYDVTHFGWQFVGNPLKFYPDEEVVSYVNKPGGIKLLPNPGNHPFGANMLQNYLRMENPDLFWCLCDSFMLFDWINNIDFAPAKSMFYFPSDGEYFPFGCENVLRKFQYVIAMSKFAQSQIKRLFNIDVDYIPHGIDTEFFKPVDEITKKQLREKWSPRFQTDLQDKFIISSVGRNQGRKALPEFLKVLGKFVKGKEKDVRIILHCDPEDPAGIGPPQWLFSLLQRYGLEHVVRFSGTKVWYQFPFEDYREMFQIADIHALATTGEGFGIPTIESQSCGLPNVITDYTTSKELVGEPKSGIIVPTAYELTGTWTVERGFVDHDKMAEALETLYKDENLRKEMGKRARENALKYDWNKVVFPMWSKKISEILEE